MIKIFRPRQQGKTTDLIKLSEATGHYILVADRKRADCVFQMAEKMGCHILTPVTVIDYFRTHGFAGSYIKDILIDDADAVLRMVFDKVNIEAITMTYDKKETEDWQPRMSNMKKWLKRVDDLIAKAKALKGET